MSRDPVGPAGHVAEEVGGAEDPGAVHDREAGITVRERFGGGDAPQREIERHLEIVQEMRSVVALRRLLSLLGNGYLVRVGHSETEAPAKHLLPAPGAEPFPIAMTYAA